jgi:hypothetical protein
MRTPLIPAAILAALAALALPAPAAAGPIEKACNRSERQAATQSLCACIQQAADAALSATDQRRVARFFNDPDAAHRVKLSDRDRDDAFWARYRRFGETAEAHCGAG